MQERNVGHPVSQHDFNVLSSSTNTLELLIRETLLIHKCRSGLLSTVSILGYAYFLRFLTVSCLLFVILQ